MLILRIRQAECALADGRLDEAFEIAQTDGIIQHHRGQRLIGRLARAFADRGRQSLEANRVQYALADCNKAEKLAGNMPQVTQLRLAICSAVQQQQENHQQHHFTLEQAKKQIDNGWLSAGERILDDNGSESDPAAEMLRRQAVFARLHVDEVVEKAEQALSRNDLEEAMDTIGRLDARGSKNGKLTQIAAKVRSAASDRIKGHIEQGRIDLAGALLQRLTLIAGDSTDVAELRLILTQCNQAAEHIAAGRPGAAVPFLRKAKGLVPSAKWLGAAVEHAQQADSLLEDLATGPLGLGISDAAAALPAIPIPDANQPPRRNRADAPGANYKPMETAASALPSRLVMQMDAVGSFLVLRSARVSIGPISSSSHPDVGLIAEPNLPTVTIERVDGDYFLRSPKPIEVGGKLVTEKLLRDGDTIALSPRCRMKFSLPNPASTTGLLTLSGARLGRPDIRHVVLMDRELLVGAAQNNHIRTERCDSTVAFYMHNDRMLCRAKETLQIAGQPAGPQTALPVEERIAVGRLSLVLART